MLSLNDVTVGKNQNGSNFVSSQSTYCHSYRSNRLGLSQWDPYPMCRGTCLELYYCNMVEWFWWDSSLISTTNWFKMASSMGVIPFLTACHACVLMLYCIGTILCYDYSFEWQIKFCLSLIVPEMTYYVLSGTLSNQPTKYLSFNH